MSDRAVGALTSACQRPSAQVKASPDCDEEYAPAVDVRVLGPVELLTGTGRTITVPGTKMRGLVAVLALDAGATVAPRRLIEALWGEQDVSGPNAVQVAVSRLRRVLADAGEAECVVTRPTGYRLDVAPDAVDALRFESLVDRARRADADPATVVELLSEALALWRGVPLEGAPDRYFANEAAWLAHLDQLGLGHAVTPDPRPRGDPGPEATR